MYKRFFCALLCLFAVVVFAAPSLAGPGGSEPLVRKRPTASVPSKRKKTGSTTTKPRPSLPLAERQRIWHEAHRCENAAADQAMREYKGREYEEADAVSRRTRQLTNAALNKLKKRFGVTAVDYDAIVDEGIAANWSWL